MADIHGNDRALRAVLDFLKGRVSRILFCGDVAGYYSFVHRCLGLWDPMWITAVRGNHDEVLLNGPDSTYLKKYGDALVRERGAITDSDRELVRSWPRAQSLNIGQTRVYLCHGAPWDELEGRVYPDFSEWERFEQVPADIIVLGHTHYPMVKEWKCQLIVNPGSVGQPRNEHGPYAFCAEIDLTTREVMQHKITYDAAAIILDDKTFGTTKEELGRYLIGDSAR